MILVNTGQSYPAAARLMASSSTSSRTQAAGIKQLEAVTSSAWPEMTDATLRGAADYLLGTCEGVVTVAYRVRSWERVTYSKGTTKLAFTVLPAVKLTGLIGAPQPGGPWRRGEARGTRRVTLDGDNLAGLGGDIRQWRQAVLTVARSIAAVTSPPDPAASQVVVSTAADGTVTVDVPAGVAVLIRPRPS